MRFCAIFPAATKSSEEEDEATTSLLCVAANASAWGIELVGVSHSLKKKMFSEALVRLLCCSSHCHEQELCVFNVLKLKPAFINVVWATVARCCQVASIYPAVYF